MSYVRLNITDQTQTINDEVHGYFGDALVAALTAEPETVEELGLALARFIKPQGDWSPFAGFRKGENFESYDVGLVVIDLAARVVAIESSYSQPAAEGSFRAQSEFAEEDVWVPYRLSDEWLCVYSLPEYEGVRERRRAERLSAEPLDAREVLYGRALLEFIARECLAARDADDEELRKQLHAQWLMTARADLRGQTPREVLLEKQEFIDFELHSRALQWSFTKECPPPLPLSSHAYRCAGFGTQEIVVYYELVRYLLDECLVQAKADTPLAATIERLEQLEHSWLNLPQGDYAGRTPARIIESERQRVNMTMSAHESIVDEDCEVCQTLAADFDTPMFWHLDGSNMDGGFAFSFAKTREEFAAEERRREEFNREFEREWQASKDNQSPDESLLDSDGELPF